MRKIKIVLPFILIAALVFAAIGIGAAAKKGNSEEKMLSLTLWQIDGFEGGKGSRAGYLSGVAREFSKSVRCYITVTSLSADAARENIGGGEAPDLISYPAGAYGFESSFSGKSPYDVWCRGGYCFISLKNGDFSDITASNTVINSGKDNFSAVAALFCGVYGAAVAEPTSAYVGLINGKYKYLLGTQRDVYRMKTRGVAFNLKPVTEFNDLYQNISVTARTADNRNAAEAFVKFLLSRSDGVSALGLMFDGKILHDDEVRQMEGLDFEYRLCTPVSENTRRSLEGAIADGNIKLIKNIIK